MIPGMVMVPVAGYWGDGPPYSDIARVVHQPMINMPQVENAAPLPQHPSTYSSPSRARPQANRHQCALPVSAMDSIGSTTQVATVQQDLQQQLELRQPPQATRQHSPAAISSPTLAQPLPGGQQSVSKADQFSCDPGLDSIDFSVPRTQPYSTTSTATLPTPSPKENEDNDWPAPDDVDPTVWAQLPANMQRELLLHQATASNGSERLQDSRLATTRPCPPIDNGEVAKSRRSQSVGDSALSGPTGTADDPMSTMIIEVMARISVRTLRTKQWKPSVCVIKNKCELLVFRSRVDWLQYRDSRRDASTDLIHSLNEIQDLLKKHVVFQTKLVCTPIKSKYYKGYGNLHHFTLEETGSVVAKFASTNANDLFQLRNAIAVGVRVFSGRASQADAPSGWYHPQPSEDAPR